MSHMIEPVCGASSIYSALHALEMIDPEKFSQHQAVKTTELWSDLSHAYFLFLVTF